MPFIAAHELLTCRGDWSRVKVEGIWRRIARVYPAFERRYVGVDLAAMMGEKNHIVRRPNADLEVTRDQ